jgi:predicted nucleic acid-binding protein
MARPFTVDASVFLNAFNPSEAGHTESRRVLAWLQEQSTPIIVPTLVLPEVAATISRVRGDAALARLLRDKHQKALAKSTGLTRQVSRISVSTLLAGRQIKDVTDLGQALSGRGCRTACVG